MKITLVLPGHFKNKNLLSAVDDYLKRSCRYAKVHFELLHLSQSEKAKDPVAAQDRALMRFMESRGNRSTLVVLSERGTLHKSSVDFSNWLRDLFDRGATEVVFAVGGAHEYGAAIMKQAHIKLALSSLTLSHELAMTLMSEQIYRALTIMNGHPYHNE